MGQDMVGMAHLCFTWCPLGPLKAGGWNHLKAHFLLSPLMLAVGGALWAAGWEPHKRL